MDTATILTFRAESDDITVVARMISDALFGGIPFSPCMSGRMGAFPALQLDRNVLGLSVYVVHMNSRDPREYTLELECDHHPDSPLLSDFVAQRLKAIPEINVSTVSTNMVFTQGRGFVLGASFGSQIRSLRCRVLVCHAAEAT